MFEKLIDFIQGANIAGASSAKKSITTVAREVIAGDWGDGDERKKKLKKAGYDYKKVQAKVNQLLSSREMIIKNMKAWAKKIEKSGKYKYVYFNEPYGKECAVCHPHGGKNKGWQCIGFTFAIWHHAGLPSKCNCHVIDNETYEKMLNAKTDAEATKIARERIGIKDVKVIRNDGKKIPSNKLKAGDILICFNGKKYKHNAFYMGSGKVADCTDGRKPNIKTTSNLTTYQKKMPIKLAIRYTGDGVVKLKPASKTTSTTSTPTSTPAKKVKKKYTGKLPSTNLKKTKAEVINDTIKWAKWIARDNRFHYGHGKDAHHNGCYFCGTQPKSKKKAGIKKWETSYCCNPFVTAAFAHGGGIPEAMKLCSHGKSWDMGNGPGSYAKSPLFDNLGKIPVSKLKKGDVLTGYNNGHVMLYVGDGKVAHAGSEDDNKVRSKSWNYSIRVSSFSYEKVFRYNGNGFSCKRIISHGEVSKRVAKWQAFLDWYFDGKVGSADGIFGDNTLKWTKKFQEKEIGKGQGDGLVGEKTLLAAANAEK